MNKGEFKNPVFLIALILCAAIAVWAIAFNESFTDVSNAIFGFLNIMSKVIDEEKPDYLAAAFDLPSPTFRHELYADYKGTRSSAPD